MPDAECRMEHADVSVRDHDSSICVGNLASAIHPASDILHPACARGEHMGTLSTELAPHVERLRGPRIYADANVPAGIVAFMREKLHWDVLSVMEHDDLRRAPDLHHFNLARQLHRTLVTIDRDYLDDERFPPTRSPGVLVVWAPNERLLARTLQRVDAVLFRPAGDDPLRAMPLQGRKLVVDPAWTGEALEPV
jgi:hypothetical protein